MKAHERSVFSISWAKGPSGINGSGWKSKEEGDGNKGWLASTGGDGKVNVWNISVRPFIRLLNYLIYLILLYA